MSTWAKKKMLITVKAYPNPSAKHGESVCTAGLTEEGFIRLHPLDFRSLEEELKFRKYDVIEIVVQKHSSDPRPESFRPWFSTLKFFAVHFSILSNSCL